MKNSYGMTAGRVELNNDDECSCVPAMQAAEPSRE